MGAAEGALSVEEGTGGSSPPPRLATLAVARAGSGRRGTPDICREVFEEFVADGHAVAAAASRAGRRPRGCPLVCQSIFHNNPLKIMDLGGGVMGCRWFHSNFQATQSGLSLNTDIFITNTVKSDFPLANQMVGNLNKTHWAKAKNEVNNSRIKTSPANTEYKMVCLSERNCYEQMFSLKQLEMPVYAYFVKNRGMELRYSGDFPCINAGKPKRPAYHPIELCSLVPLQSLTTLERSPFVEKSRQILLKRMSVLSDVMRRSSYGTESMLSACRIPIFQGFTQVAGRILQPPKVYSWINQNHLLKEGIILIMTWCFYHKNILGAHHGFISTYALATLVLYIFDVINNCSTRPEVLHIFMEFFSKIDCEKKKSSLWEPVSTSYLPNVTGNFFRIPSAYSFGVQMLSNTQSCSKLTDLEGYRTKSASLMKMEGITSGKKRKKTSIEQPLDPPAEKIHIRGDEKVEEAVLPDAREKKKFTPIRRRIKIQDLRRQIKLGTRSRFDAKEWICDNCSWTNKPQKHLIAYLPPFFCENCQYDLLKMGHYEFSFSMADVTVNGFSPIGNIKDQGNTDHCTVYSTNQCLEITDRMSKILVGEEPEGVCNEGPILSTKDLLAKTEDMMIRCNINQRKGDHKFNRKTLVVAFEVAEAEGVNVELTKVEQDNEMKPRTVKALGKQFVPCDFASIAQKLADGIPQVGSFLSGKKLYNLKHGQIYKAPEMPEDENHKKKVVWHAVVLIGAGKRRKKYFYHFVNSLGVKFCLRIPINPAPTPKSTWVGGVHCGKSKQFPGGFGKVRATDVMLDTLQFVRYPDSNTPKQPWVSFNYCAVR